MKRLLCIVLALLAGFAAFSFIANREPGSAAPPVVFVDEAMGNAEIVARDVGERLLFLRELRSVGTFSVESLESLILTHPDALFITDKALASGTYALLRSPYRFTPVAVTGRGSAAASLDGRRVDQILLSQRETYDRIAEGVTSGAYPIGVIPVEKLSLEMKPLTVDGVFPSFGNIREGSYPKAIRAFVYARSRGRWSSREDVLRSLGGAEEDCFTIIAGGDIMLARGAGSAAAAFGSDYPFREIARELDRHDIACANLESPISSRGTKFQPDKGIYFRADPGVIEGIERSGLDFLSLANNHALDWGPDALSDTFQALRKAGVQWAGAGTSADEAFAPAVFSAGGVSVAFIALNDVYPFFCSEGGKTAMTLALKEKTLGERIRRLKARYDVVVASVHAGVEYERRQEEAKERSFRHLVDLGVDLVLGHHPHVVQEIEIYNGRLIAYSLGNFIFDQNWSSETSEGLLLEVGFVQGRAVYYNPMPISIRNAQAKLVEPSGTARERNVL